MNKRARKHLEIALGGNMNIATLKPLALIEIMTDFAKKEVEAINYTRCCESVKDKYTHTFEVDLNSEKRKEQYNKHIEQIHNAPCKVYLYDGDKYIELKP
jgi:hypothetical protein